MWYENCVVRDSCEGDCCKRSLQVVRYRKMRGGQSALVEFSKLKKVREIGVHLQNVKAIEFCVRSTGRRYLKVVPHVQKGSKIYEDCHHDCVNINGRVFGDSEKRLLSMFGLDEDMSRSCVSKYCMMFYVRQCLVIRSTADEE